MALRPKHLRWVFIETGTARMGAVHGVGADVRSLHWHDATRTWLVLRTLLAQAVARDVEAAKLQAELDEVI